MSAPTPLPDGLVLSFYGDDFTGSTDAMEVLSLAGLPTVLFLRTPEPADLARFLEARAVGIAGVSRSKPPAWMDEHLPAMFEALASLGAPLAHYKVCSTFDSSAQTGSIGRAIDVAQAVFRSPFVPVVVGAPALRRYVCFGNLFATVDGVPYRIDRHPTMSRHPVTPMGEADLTRHLAAQTGRPIGLVDLLGLAGDPDLALAQAREAGAEIVLIDVMDEVSLIEAGRLVWESRDRPTFSASSSGLQYALAAYWRSAGLLDPALAPASVRPADRIAVVSGSCSPVTARQIAWASAHDFATLRLDPLALIDGEAERERAIAAGLAALSEGRSPVLYTASGPDDPSVGSFKAAAQTSGLGEDEANARVGRALGDILSAVLERTGLRRAIVAGGDTSGMCAGRLGIDALTMAAPTAPGSPLCRGHAPGRALDGIEIALKGGQVGGPDYFGAVRQGHA
ncbi:four-carbon acid sugar kinase family protein [Marinivivus vitaminiproducens]|uniref:four-carbon acid sugar kinase family protein n=1 Tax=Marinivivus vitaminiproducens TaxID=3035935 RepID=UPI00279A52DC|nr:four-carbon acid sugar kinase family protein [Geminicoccaceae bacterium SCSIO 64248]